MASGILVESFSAIISNTLEIKRNRDDINKFIKKYIDKNTDILFSNIPNKRLIFKDEYERKFIYDIFNLKPKDISGVVRKIPTIKSNWNIANDSFSHLMTLIIRDATINNYDRETLNNCIVFLALSMYPSIHYNCFKYVNDDCMRYTVNNISNKYLLKKYGSVMKTIVHTAMVNHEKYKNDLISNDDFKIYSYFINLRNRIKEFMINFMNSYIDNMNNKKYLSYETESNSEENYHENDNMSLQITRLVQKICMKFLTSEVNYNLIKTVCNMGEGCDKNVLKNAINSIKKDDVNKINELISLIIQIYIVSGFSVDSIKSKKFIYECLLLYTKSNTKDDRLLKIKELLDYFLEHHCDTYTKFTRSASKGKYRKALFMYFVFFIQYAK